MIYKSLQRPTMHFKTIYLYILVTLNGALYGHDTSKSPTRNMIILLDQEGGIENIGDPVRHFLSCKLQSALQEKTAPILINAALLNTFIEKRKSIEQIAKIPDTQEEKALKKYNDINERLNSSYRHFREKGIDPIQCKQLMLEEINKEFYSLPAIVKNLEQKKDPRISGELQQALRSYLTKFDQNDWETYTNQKSFYLFVPKKHIQELEMKEPDHKPIEQLSKKEILLGLKVNHLTHLEKIEDVGRLYFDSHVPTHMQFADHISDFFVTKDDLKNSPMPYEWNVAFSGHGGTQYTPATDAYGQATVADLPINDFQKILAFLQHKIKTKSFHFATCFGGGKRIKMVFDDAGSPKYNFAIIGDCLSDGHSYCLIRSFNFPTNKAQPLTAQDITCDEQGNWHLLLDYGYKWKKFFKELAKNSFDDNLAWLYPALAHITEDLLTTISLIRPAQAQAFFPVLPESCSKLNDALMEHTVNEQSSSVIFTNKYAILVESPIVSLPVSIENFTKTPRIISLQPGNSTHYFKSIQLKKSDGVLNVFWPIDGDRFDRQFIIEELNFPLVENTPLTKILNLSGSQVQLKHVFVHTQKGNTMRIFFQTELGKAYMLVANKKDTWAQDVDLKGIHELTPAVAQTYLNRYNQLKSEILANPSRRA